MAAGTITEAQLSKSLEILTAATATNSPPSGATAGFSVGEMLKTGSPTSGGLFIKSTAGSGTVTVTLRLWGYNGAAAAWSPCGTGTAALKGVLNGGTAIAEDASIGADLIRHYEEIGLPWALDRIYLEITAIGGTATAISAWLVLPAAQS